MDNNSTLFNNVEATIEDALNEDIQNAQDEESIVQVLVGPDKKFKSVSDLARSVIYKDNHIKRLEEETKTLRQQTTETKTVDEILKALNNQNIAPRQNHDNDFSNQGQGNTDRTVEYSPPTTEDVTAKVLAALDARNTEKTSSENLVYTKRELVKAFGSDYPNVLRQRAGELGLDDAMIDTMAKKSPKALLNLFNVNTSSTNVAPNTQFNSSSNQGISTEKTFSYYENMRKKDPSRYMSSKIQNEILEQAFKLGEKFNK